VLLPLVFALDRPVMVDDPLYLKVAAQILRDPLRPYDFTMNWYGWPELFWDITKNPPLVSYWLAVVRGLGATSEWLAHVAMLPFAVAAVLGGVRLARRFVADAGWATTFWAASPAFLVSAATLMADVPALAASLWGVSAWIEGVDNTSSRARRFGALLVGVAFVLKYTALVAVLALVAYVVVGREPGQRRRGLGDLWVASLPAFAWGLLTLGTTGRVHVVDALVIGGGGLSPNPGWFGHRGVAILTFVAGASITLALVTLATLRDRRAALIGAGAVALGVTAALVTPWIWSPQGLRHGAQLMVGVLATAGALLLLRSLDEGLRDPAGRFLAVWALLHVAYLWFWSWSIAARFVLPALVPLALLLARRLERGAVGPRAIVSGVAVAAGLVAAIVVLRADGFPGELYRRALPALAAQARSDGRRAYFVGAWGFHYYAEQAGLPRLDTKGPAPRVGDLIFQSYYAGNNELPPTLVPRLREVGNVAAPAPPFGLHTMNINVGAGFHSTVFGPLPYFRAHLPAEGVIVWQVVR
jgi:hypothetical protein